MSSTTAHWRKSSHSGGGNTCVEVAALPGRGIAVRDSTNPTGATLLFSRVAWHAFISDLKQARPTPSHRRP